MSHLIVQDIHKSYGALTALQGLDLTVEKGEFFALLGPSAAGKTTTLRTICGIEAVDQGRIIFAGEDITGTEVRGRDMAMVFQSFALYPHLSIYDNLAFPLRQSGMAKGDVTQRVNEVAEMLRLGHTLARKPGTASGGEQQSVAIGRALVRRPSLLLRQVSNAASVSRQSVLGSRLRPLLSAISPAFFLAWVFAVFLFIVFFLFWLCSIFGCACCCSDPASTVV